MAVVEDTAQSLTTDYFSQTASLLSSCFCLRESFIKKQIKIESIYKDYGEKKNPEFEI